MFTTEEPIGVDEIIPFTAGGRTVLTKAKLLDVTFANPTEAKAALELPGSYAPLVDGKVPDANLPDDLVRLDDLVGIGGDGGGGGAVAEDSILFPSFSGSNNPSAIALATEANGFALGSLPFSVLFPRLALDQAYLDNPPSGAFHLFRFANSGSVWGHVWSVLFYPQGGNGIQIRHYGATAPQPGNSYIRVRTEKPVSELASAPFSLALISPKASPPKMFHNGVPLSLIEDVSGTGTPPANSWGTAVIHGYALVNFTAANSIGFAGQMAPPYVLLGALSDAEAATWGKSGALPVWAQYGTSTNMITSGTLLFGRKYRIVDNSGGANFAGAGAPNNDVGTEFVVNVPAGVTPTWGTGAVVQLGLLIAPGRVARNSYLIPDVSGYGRSLLAVQGASTYGRDTGGRCHLRYSWSNTHEAKSLYGNFPYWMTGRTKINSIILVASGNTTVDVGDGTTGTYYASGVSLSAGVPVEVTLSQKFPADLRVTIDPSANYTGWVDVIIDYSII